MENSQLTQPVQQDKKIKLEAEKLFRRFWIGVTNRKPVGLLTEIEGGKKVVSFESYLRETGKGEYIEAYCSHIKAVNYVADMVTFTNNRRWPMTIISYLKVLLIFLTTFLPGIFLYLLLVAFLATFDISFWGWLPAILFALTGPVLITIMSIPPFKHQRVERKAENLKIEYIIKNFDNDELTYLRTKSKLFKEE